MNNLKKMLLVAVAVFGFTQVAVAHDPVVTKEASSGWFSYGYWFSGASEDKKGVKVKKSDAAAKDAKNDVDGVTVEAPAKGIIAAAVGAVVACGTGAVQIVTNNPKTTAVVVVALVATGAYLVYSADEDADDLN